jgi:hypothetical protein
MWSCLEADVDGTPFGRYRLIALIGEGGMARCTKPTTP